MRATVAVAVTYLSLVSITFADNAQAAIRQPTNIAAQSLAPALKTLAEDRNVQLVYRSDLVKDQRTGGAVGELTFDEALTQLLSGTELTFKYLENNAITIAPIGSLATPAEGEGTRGRGTGESASGGEARDSSSSPSDGRVGQAGEVFQGEGKGKNFWSRFLLAQTSSSSSSSADGEANSSFSSGQESKTSSQGSSEQVKLEEIMVTSERRSEDVQKIAASVSVRSGEDLRQQGRYSLSAILQDLPGVMGGAAVSPGTAASGGSSGTGTDSIASGITIRGIQSNSGSGGTITSTPTTAALYVDDVYSGVGGGFDLDRVEVLRGPQGTLYGRSATSGVVAIHTHDPDLGQFGGNAAVELGNYRLRHYTAAINVPVGETLALRASGNSYDREGYYQPDGGALRNRQGRAKLLWKPTDDLSVLVGFAADNTTTHTGGTNATVILTSPDSTYRFANTPLGEGTNNSRQYWANVVWDFGPATLTYVPAVRTWKASFVTHSRSTTPTLNFDQTRSTPQDNFITHELRFSSNPGSTLIWQAGTLWYDNNLVNSSRSVYFPSGALSVNTDTARTTKALGVFSEATYPVTSTWRITGGLRYDSTKVETTQTYTSNTNPAFLPEVLVSKTLTGGEGKRNYYNWTYKFRVEHDLTPSNLVYAMTSTGFSPGDLQLTRNATQQPIVLDLESKTLKSYEIGTKNRFLDENLQVNGTVFYEDYGGYQTAAINISSTSVSAFQVLTAHVQTYGAELELLYQFTRNDRLGFNFGWTNAYFLDKFTPISGTSRTFGTYYGQDKIQGVVPVVAQLALDHGIDLPGNSKLMLHGDVRWLSPHYEGPVSSAQLATAASYWNDWAKSRGEYISDLNATWSRGKLSVTGYVRNIGDNRYKTQVDITGNSGNLTAVPYDPRTVGFIFNVGW